MQTIIANLDPYEFKLNNGEVLKLSIESCEIKPGKVNSQIDVKERKIFPSEARLRAVSYTANCSMTLAWSRNGKRQMPIDFDLGPIPAMIRVSS